MSMSAGRECYNADAIPVIARGVLYTDAELDDALVGSVSQILWDDAGTANLREIFVSFRNTEFAEDSIERILSQQCMPENWRVGECMAEVFLVEHRDCEFPWPSGRDLRNPSASPAGADLVGFQKIDDEAQNHRFAFGEVKSSEEEKWPPSVMSDLRKQLEDLRDSTDVKDSLVRYLGHHANEMDWFPRYQSAAIRYLSNPADVSLFGVLVRDVEPKREDLAGRAKVLASKCPMETSIELRAMYLPSRSINSLSERAKKAKGGRHGHN